MVENGESEQGGEFWSYLAGYGGEYDVRKILADGREECEEL